MKDQEGWTRWKTEQDSKIDKSVHNLFADLWGVEKLTIQTENTKSQYRRAPAVPSQPDPSSGLFYYTSHGYHIAGPVDESPRAKARCGGPGICAICAHEKNVILSGFYR